MFKTLLLLITLFSISACQTTGTDSSLYKRLGGQAGIESIADRFVRIIIKDPRTEVHFKETDLDRFFEKLVEQLCEVSSGPCTYKGDSMELVHKGINISEKEFNVTVEILQQAMNDNDIPLAEQNQLLALLAPMRGDMLYK